MSSLLFIIAIVSDETTVFQRLCLRAIGQHSLRMQPLFFLLQLSALMLSTLVPSSIIVIFYTVVIERFVATVEEECLGVYQRRPSHAPRSVSVDMYLEYTPLKKRYRVPRNSSTTGVRKASVMGDTSETTGRTDASASTCSSLVRHYRMHPEGKNVPKTRRTSFHLSKQVPSKELLVCGLPSRKIRSSVSGPESRQPWSILKSGSISVRRSLQNGPAGSTRFLAEYDPNMSPAERNASVFQGSGATSPRSDTPPPMSSGMRKPSLLPSRYLSLPPLASVVTSSRKMSSRRSSVASITSKDDQPLVPQRRKHLDSLNGWARQMMAGGSFKLLQDNFPSDESRKSASETEELPYMKVRASLKGDPKSAADANAIGAFLELKTGAQTLNRMHRSELLSAKDVLGKSSTVVVITESPRASLSLVSRTSSKAPVDKSSHSCDATERLACQERPPSRCTSSLLGDRTEFGEAPTSALDASLNQRIPTSVSERKIFLTPAEMQSSSADSRLLLDAASFYSKDLNSGNELQSSLSEAQKVRALCLNLRPAFIVGTAFTAIFGNLIHVATVPTQNSLMKNLKCFEGKCPLRWWSWMAVSIPVVLVPCTICWTYIYLTLLLPRNKQQVQPTSAALSSRDAAELGCTISRRGAETFRAAVLVYYFYASIEHIFSASDFRNLEASFFSMSIVIMSMMPKSEWRDCCSKTMFSWYSIKTRMPWNVILMFGAVGSFTKLATHYQLVKKFFDKLGNQFWTHGSQNANQYILMCVAAVFSEIIHSGALTEAMAPIVINIATDSGAPPVLYLVPVSLAASVNIIMPISLPMLIIREYLDIPCLQMV
ncbi:unnamed protein product, partial [Ixodes persulcatus]